MALNQGLSALNAFSKFCAPMCEMEISYLVAHELCESGKPEEALSYLALPRKLEFGNSPRMRYQVLLIEAYAHLQRGDRAIFTERLREALAIGRVRQYFGNFFWFPRMVARLCTEALRSEIEVEYVQQLIKKGGLLPEDTTVENWT